MKYSIHRPNKNLNNEWIQYNSRFQALFGGDTHLLLFSSVKSHNDYALRHPRKMGCACLRFSIQDLRNPEIIAHFRDFFYVITSTEMEWNPHLLQGASIRPVFLCISLRFQLQSSPNDACGWITWEIDGSEKMLCIFVFIPERYIGWWYFEIIDGWGRHLTLLGKMAVRLGSRLEIIMRLVKHHNNHIFW